MKKTKSVDFYTQEQLDTLKTAIKNKEHRTLSALARHYSKQWNRTPNALAQKIYAISLVLKGKEPVKYYKTKAKPAAISVQPEVGVELPKGMTFEGTPKKVILYKDHFRVYL
jgi:hypothetical protein